jgi:DNA-binding response OmpR family regulator
MGRSPYRHLGSDLCPSRKGARGQALVISAFPVNRIIIAHSIDRIYRMPLSVDPSAAVSALSNPDICLVVVDATGEPDELAPTFSRLEELRDSDSPPRILLIATGRRDGDGDAAVTFAADNVIYKPFTPDMVQSAVDQLLRGSACAPYAHALPQMR